MAPLNEMITGMVRGKTLSPGASLSGKMEFPPLARSYPMCHSGSPSLVHVIDEQTEVIEASPMGCAQGHTASTWQGQNSDPALLSQFNLR